MTSKTNAKKSSSRGAKRATGDLRSRSGRAAAIRGGKISKGVINGSAISLPKPAYPATA